MFAAFGEGAVLVRAVTAVSHGVTFEAGGNAQVVLGAAAQKVTRRGASPASTRSVFARCGGRERARLSQSGEKTQERGRERDAK